MIEIMFICCETLCGLSYCDQNRIARWGGIRRWLLIYIKESIISWSFWSQINLTRIIIHFFRIRPPTMLNLILHSSNWSLALNYFYNIIVLNSHLFLFYRQRIFNTYSNPKHYHYNKSFTTANQPNSLLQQLLPKPFDKINVQYQQDSPFASLPSHSLSEWSN